MGRLVKRFGRVVPSELFEANVRGGAVLAAARREADALLARARADAEGVRAEAEGVRAEARRSGEAAGRADAEAAFTGLLIAARAEAERVRADALGSSERLALRMAEKVIGRAVELDPAVMVEIAAEVLAAARARTGVVRLRVHPEDHDRLVEARPLLSARLASAVELELVADPSVGRAGCIVETALGTLDARLETQLAVMERAVFGDLAPPPQRAVARGVPPARDVKGGAREAQHELAREELHEVQDEVQGG